MERFEVAKVDSGFPNVNPRYHYSDAIALCQMQLWHRAIAFPNWPSRDRFSPLGYYVIVPQIDSDAIAPTAMQIL